MALADELRAATRAGMIAAGCGTVTVRRAGSPNIEAVALARVIGFQPEELVGAIQQGDRKVILLAEDLEAQGWPVPPKKMDRLITGDGQLVIQSVDDMSRRAEDTVIAYEIVARGM